MGQRYRRSGLARDNVSSLPGCRMNRSDSPSGDTNSDENRVEVASQRQPLSFVLDWTYTRSGDAARALISPGGGKERADGGRRGRVARAA